MLRWLVPDLNRFFALPASSRTRLRSQPLIVVLTTMTCAIVASYLPKTLGIKTGTLIYDARKLCPGMKVVPADTSFVSSSGFAMVSGLCSPYPKCLLICPLANLSFT